MAHNVFMLDAILRKASKRKSGLCVAVLDVRKAFDSVSHSAILRILKKPGVQEKLCKYIEAVFTDGTSRICMQGIQSDEARKRGDPTSSVVFNTAMDHVIAGLPQRVGLILGGTRIRTLASADDLVLFAAFSEGLRVLLGAVIVGLRDCGLELNPAKCRNLAVAVPGKRKLAKLDEGDM